MAKTLTLQGSMTALVTPFTKGGKVDHAAFAAHVEWQIAQGTRAVVPTGTTGESATLAREEQLDVIRSCVKAAAGRVPVVAGTGKNDTRETVELTKAARDLGADAALVVTPYYNKPTQEGLYRHYMTVAEASDIPIVLYNGPGRTGVNMTAETVARCAANPRIIATKEASGDLVQAAEIHRLCGSKIAVISGEDALTLALIAQGAAGVISVTSNVVPADMAKLCALAASGDLPGARAMHLKLLPLMKALFLESNPVPVKAALSFMKRMGADVRLPLAPISDSVRAKVEASLRDLGITSGVPTVSREGQRGKAERPVKGRR